LEEQVEQKKTYILFSLLAVVMTLGALWYVNRPVIAREPSRQEVQAQAQNGGYHLLNTGELATLIRHEGQKVLLVDTRQPWEYRTGHIKGALNFSMEPTWWARWRSQGPLARFLGPDKDRLIVFY
jgi:3-mercaptopyruvate sulfurtransferase SseA